MTCLKMVWAEILGEWRPEPLLILSLDMLLSPTTGKTRPSFTIPYKNAETKL